MAVIRLPKMVEMRLGIRGEKPATRQMLYFYQIVRPGRRSGVMLAMSTPQEGQHHDLFQIQTLFDEICQLLKEAGLDLKGLFLNADSGFDSADFVAACAQEEIIANVKENPRNSANQQKELDPSGSHIFDDVLYADRSVIEHANAWIDGFKALLVRFEFSVRNWMSLHFIAFSVIFLRKINRKRKV